MNVPPDKVRIAAYYDEKDGSCHSIDVALNYDGISREDLTETIRAVFCPDGHIRDATQRNRELGSTEVIQVPGRNGASVTHVNIARQSQGR